MCIDYELIGKSIKARRKELRLTQKQVAEKAGTSQGYVADIEKGKIDNLSLNKIGKIAEALNMNLARLFNIAESKDFTITNKEKEIIEMYRQLTKEQQIKLEGIIEGMLLAAEEEASKKGA